MPDLKHPSLNKYLVKLNRQIDHWNELVQLQERLPLGKPVDRIKITAPFGYRIDPFNGMRAMHEGIDIGGMIGEPVFVTAPGKVVRAGWWGAYGNMVEVDHGMGFRTRYGHMSRITVKVGDKVNALGRIGALGNTGRSTGPHLHYEVRIKGDPVNPYNFLKVRAKDVLKG